MKFTSVLAFAVSVSAAPWQGWGNQNCVSDAQAAYFASQSAVYLAHNDPVAAKAAAYSIFDENIVEYGDSINALRQAPVSWLSIYKIIHYTHIISSSALSLKMELQPMLKILFLRPRSPKSTLLISCTTVTRLSGTGSSLESDHNVSADLL